MASVVAGRPEDEQYARQATHMCRSADLPPEDAAPGRGRWEHHQPLVLSTENTLFNKKNSFLSLFMLWFSTLGDNGNVMGSQQHAHFFAYVSVGSTAARGGRRCVTEVACDKLSHCDSLARGGGGFTPTLGHGALSQVVAVR